MDGAWDLSDLYSSPDDPALEKDKQLAKTYTAQLEKNPARSSVWHRFHLVTEKLDAYSYLLSAVSSNQPAVLDFCLDLNRFVECCRQTAAASPQQPNTDRAVCLEYDKLLNTHHLRPGYTKQLYHQEDKVRKEAYAALADGWDTIGDEVTELYNRRLAGIAENLENLKQGGGICTEGEVKVFFSLLKQYSRLPGKVYARKAEYLGKDMLDPWDIFAPYPVASEISWEQAAKYACAAAGRLGPLPGRAARHFFNSPWIDYSIRPGKQAGAFTHPVIPSLHPYILINFSGSIRDTLALIHELFHGVHFYLAGQKNRRQGTPSESITETAAALGELLAKDVLNERGADIHIAENLILKLFRQACLFRWEVKAAAMFKEQGLCRAEELESLWIGINRGYFGESLPLPPSYRKFWIGTSHFFHFPFYGLNYTFASLAALVLISQNRHQSRRFQRQVLALLLSGESASPLDILRQAAEGSSFPEVLHQCFGEAETLTEKQSNPISP